MIFHKRVRSDRSGMVEAINDPSPVRPDPCHLIQPTQGDLSCTGLAGNHDLAVVQEPQCAAQHVARANWTPGQRS